MAEKQTIHDLKLKSIQYRKKILTLIVEAGGGHTGGDLSCIDVLNVLYNRILRVTPGTCSDPDRDRFIQSKGHAVEALYVVLADRGYFEESELKTVGRFGSLYIGHPTRKICGIEQNTGALGHGLSLGAGAALAGKMDKRDFRVFTLLGDGELAEGSNWEAAMTASHYELDNLIAIIDRNKLQISGKTEDVCGLEPLPEKFSAFGWETIEVEGNDIDALVDCFEKVPCKKDRPTAVIAHTVKGKGVSFMENAEAWHHKVPSREQLDQALAELSAAEKEMMTRE